MIYNTYSTRPGRGHGMKERTRVLYLGVRLGKGWFLGFVSFQGSNGFNRGNIHWPLK